MVTATETTAQPENDDKVIFDSIPFTYLLGLHELLQIGNISYEQFVEYQKVVLPMLQNLIVTAESAAQGGE